MLRILKHYQIAIAEPHIYAVVTVHTILLFIIVVAVVVVTSMVTNKKRQYSIYK